MPEDNNDFPSKPAERKGGVLAKKAWPLVTGTAIAVSGVGLSWCSSIANNMVPLRADPRLVTILKKPFSEMLGQVARQHNDAAIIDMAARNIHTIIGAWIIDNDGLREGEHFANTMATRNMLNRFTAALEATADNLSDEQRGYLLEAITKQYEIISQDPKSENAVKLTRGFKVVGQGHSTREVMEKEGKFAPITESVLSDTSIWVDPNVIPPGFANFNSVAVSERDVRLAADALAMVKEALQKPHLIAPGR